MIFVIIIIVIVLILLKFKNYRIEFNTFFKKGLPKIDDRFGVYFITGKQGSGKSYFAIKLLLKQDKEKLNKIYTNMKSINIPGYEIVYFNKLDEIYFNTDKNCIFLLDEVARKYDKNSRTDTQFYAWLNQSRKMSRIVIMITQEWKELPMWIRRPAKYMITTYKTPLLNRFGLYTSVLGDAENMILDKDEMEWTCPPIQYTIYKRNKYIADMYDTFEAVNTL